MSYNYENEKKNINPEMYDRVKKTIFNTDKVILTFYDFGEDLVAFGSWELLAIIDKLEEEGYVELIKQKGSRQDWEYEIIKRED